MFLVLGLFGGRVCGTQPPCSGAMPRSCSVPLCYMNPRRDTRRAAIKFHEFPCDAERREAWLKNIAREGPLGKGSKWEPSDRSVVCSLHFTENDYKKDTKIKILLPTAVPTVFNRHPGHMQKNGRRPPSAVATGPKKAPPKKRRRRNLANGAIVGASDRESSGHARSQKRDRSARSRVGHSAVWRT